MPSAKWQTFCLGLNGLMISKLIDALHQYYTLSYTDTWFTHSVYACRYPDNVDLITPLIYRISGIAYQNYQYLSPDRNLYAVIYATIWPRLQPVSYDVLYVTYASTDWSDFHITEQNQHYIHSAVIQIVLISH